MRFSILPLAAFACAACSGSEPAPADTASPAATSPTAPAPTPLPAKTPAQSLLIPAAFHGIWDYVKGTCEPASDMRTEIAERGITFYESHGAVTALTVESPNRITVELAMQGEGERWTSKSTFTLSEDGKTLTPRRDGDTGEPMPLKRCA